MFRVNEWIIYNVHKILSCKNIQLHIWGGGGGGHTFSYTHALLEAQMSYAHTHRVVAVFCLLIKV